PHESGGEVARRSRDGEGEPRSTKAPSPAASRPPLPRFAGARNPSHERLAFLRAPSVPRHCNTATPPFTRRPHRANP
ncbi:MAG: hypothetical protein E5X51_32170, partial [Mesorhizobium sp.]